MEAVLADLQAQIRAAVAVQSPLVIRFEDIVEVRVVPEAKAFVLWIFVATLYGPFLYDMEVELKNGWTVPVIRKCRWGLSFTPGGYYPNVLIHGYGPGYALDWLRQNAQEKWEKSPPREGER